MGHGFPTTQEAKDLAMGKMIGSGHTEPQSYAQAILDPHWQQAMNTPFRGQVINNQRLIILFSPKLKIGEVVVSQGGQSRDIAFSLKIFLSHGNPRNKLIVLPTLSGYVNAAPASPYKVDRQNHPRGIGLFDCQVREGRKQESAALWRRRCPVCLSAFVAGEELRRLNACEHVFHAPCINAWLSSHSNCPVCRAAVIVGRLSKRPAVDEDHDLQQGWPDSASLCYNGKDL
ncbi:hypothetical protein RJ639_035311 [Escallonia herrerae]|uniref:RING-type domain-containing protein n=1 Tax=Escallonia herrerae TaxID=1293975 RepID=A0AA89B841_9ASTE|nr:hypothetical protein RJ639_035311 [Escallonia herrerae]